MADPSEKGRFIVIPSLLGDVGATNARFALMGAEREFQRVRVLACEDYPSIQDAIGVYLNDELALTGRVSTRATEARDQAMPNGVAAAR